VINRLLAFLGLQRRTPVSRDTGVASRRLVRGSYDSARTTDDNSRHWANSDCLSARQANSPQVRQTLRNRARYEVANNSYARGIVNTLANHVIGTGPRLQVLTANPEVNRAIEQAFARWSRAVRLADKLRTLVVAEVQDGEGFAQFITNNRLPTPVKLDLKPIEAEQVATPSLWILDPLRVDGITFDVDGNPQTYDVLRHHPGDVPLYQPQPTPVDADQVIHLFRIDRPGQVRGVPEITSALGLFANLRRYTEAVIAAAETAADFAAVMYSTSSAAGDQDEIEPFAAIELEKRAMLTLPDGWQLGQVKAEQPTTTYQMFKREIIAEIARCLNMPYNIAAGDSSSYNYSSGRLDHQVYYADIDIRRSRVEADALDRILTAWFDEAALIAGVIPEGLGAVEEIPHEWQWDAPAHIDEQKEANAQMTRLQSGMTSYQTEFAREGHDWETEQTRQAVALGMTLEEYRGRLADALFPTAPQPTPPAPEEETEDVTQEEESASAA
jgi:lambda family phage portal protein